MTTKGTRGSAGVGARVLAVSFGPDTRRRLRLVPRVMRFLSVMHVDNEH